MSPKVNYNAAGTNIILSPSDKKLHNHHELLHVYQEISYGILRKEWEGRLSMFDVLNAELEANWFSTRRWFAYIILAAAAVLIGITAPFWTTLG